MKAFITDYQNYCLLCGKPKDASHHLIFGTSHRRLADEDAIYIPICNSCHNMHGIESIHGNPTSSRLSKLLGQALWELNYVASEKEIKNAREQFRKRYGKSYF